VIPEIDLTSLPRPDRFVFGEFVLYRDPALYWAGKPGHTFPCRVTLDGKLENLLTGEAFKANLDYARLLPAAECMRDIDEAPLENVAEFLPSAVAWLRRHSGKQVES
jgi:hypothetical protein